MFLRCLVALSLGAVLFFSSTLADAEESVDPVTPAGFVADGDAESSHIRPLTFYGAAMWRGMHKEQAESPVVETGIRSDVDSVEYDIARRRRRGGWATLGVGLGLFVAGLSVILPLSIIEPNPDCIGCGLAFIVPICFFGLPSVLGGAVMSGVGGYFVANGTRRLGSLSSETQ